MTLTLIAAVLGFCAGVWWAAWWLEIKARWG